MPKQATKIVICGKHVNDWNFHEMCHRTRGVACTQLWGVVNAFIYISKQQNNFAISRNVSNIQYHVTNNLCQFTWKSK